LQVEAAVPASLASTLAPGVIVPVHIAETTGPFPCRVAEIAAAGND